MEAIQVYFGDDTEESWSEWEEETFGQNWGVANSYCVSDLEELLEGPTSVEECWATCVDTFD
jgi:beta-mannanase